MFNGHSNSKPPTPPGWPAGGFGTGAAYNDGLYEYDAGTFAPIDARFNAKPAIQQMQQMMAAQQVHQQKPAEAPKSVVIRHMNQHMQQENLTTTNQDLMKQLGVVNSDNGDKKAEVAEEAPKTAAFTAADLEAARAKGREEGMKEFEASRKQMESKMSEDGSLKAKMKDLFVKEMLRRQTVSGTFDLTCGTISMYKTYQETDPVVKFKKANGHSDLTGKEWNTEADCEYLHKAMKGAGTDEDAIISVVTTRCNAQRQELKKMFKTMYGEDLVDRLHSELSGDFRSLIMSLFVSPARFDAWSIKEAIYGPGTCEDTLIELMMTRTNGQLKDIKKVYPDVISPGTRAGSNLLERDIEDDTGGDFKRLLISAAQANRQELNEGQLTEAVEEICINGQGTGMFQINYNRLVNGNECKTYAKQLFAAGEGKWGTDEEVFNMIFSRRTYYELRVIWDEYVKLAQRDIVNSIDRETSGDLKQGLQAIVMNIRCRPMYFAMKLKKAMKGLGTDEETLIRIIVSRSEIDLQQIKKCFLELTKATLWQWVKDDTSGDFRKVLLNVIGKN